MLSGCLCLCQGRSPSEKEKAVPKKKRSPKEKKKKEVLHRSSSISAIQKMDQECTYLIFSAVLLGSGRTSILLSVSQCSPSSQSWNVVGQPQPSKIKADFNIKCSQSLTSNAARLEIYSKLNPVPKLNPVSKQNFKSS